MRLYKTRALAADACKSGHVTSNGRDLKASATLAQGDTFSVRKGPITYSYEILQLSENRLGAKLVPDYIRDITAPEEMEKLELLKFAAESSRARGTGRPTKKDRRDIDHFFQQL